MVTLLLRPIALSLLRHLRLHHHQCLLVHLYHLEEDGGIVVKEMTTEERIIPARKKKITRLYQDIAHAHITGGKEAIAGIMIIEDADEEKHQDVEIPREGVIITMTNHHNTKIIRGEENENTVPLPLVPPRMIPLVISKVVGGHLSVIIIV